jgi:hypothetical protein
LAITGFLHGLSPTDRLFFNVLCNQNLACFCDVAISAFREFVFRTGRICADFDKGGHGTVRKLWALRQVGVDLE